MANRETHSIWHRRGISEEQRASERFANKAWIISGAAGVLFAAVTAAAIVAFHPGATPTEQTSGEKK